MSVTLFCHGRTGRTYTVQALRGLDNDGIQAPSQ